MHPKDNLLDFNPYPLGEKATGLVDELAETYWMRYLFRPEQDPSSASQTCR